MPDAMALEGSGSGNPMRRRRGPGGGIKKPGEEPGFFGYKKLPCRNRLVARAIVNPYLICGPASRPDVFH